MGKDRGRMVSGSKGNKGQDGIEPIGVSKNQPQ
jgi:hypothetical protein